MTFDEFFFNKYLPLLGFIFYFYEMYFKSRTKVSYIVMESELTFIFELFLKFIGEMIEQK